MVHKGPLAGAESAHARRGGASGGSPALFVVRAPTPSPRASMPDRLRGSVWNLLLVGAWAAATAALLQPAFCVLVLETAPTANLGCCDSFRFAVTEESRRPRIRTSRPPPVLSALCRNPGAGLLSGHPGGVEKSRVASFWRSDVLVCFISC